MIFLLTLERAEWVRLALNITWWHLAFGVGKVCTRGCAFGFEGGLIFRNDGLISALLCLVGGVTLERQETECRRESNIKGKSQRKSMAGRNERVGYV